MSVLQEIIKTTQIYDDDLQNSLSRKMQHLDRLKKLKEDKKKNLQTKSHEMAATTRNLINSLLNTSDPFVRDRFAFFKETSEKKKGPSFLERMQKDKEVRNQFINQD